MNRNELLQATDGEILDEVKRLQYLFGHSAIIRHGLDRDDEKYVTQSVSEHIYNMMVLAQYFEPLEDPDSQWDWTKIHQMILWHDAPELETGDTKIQDKDQAVRAREQSAIATVVDKVPLGLKRDMELVMEEYEERASVESLFVKALDCLEASIMDVGEEGNDRLLISADNNEDTIKLFRNINYQHTRDFGLLFRFIEVTWNAKQHVWK